MTMGHGIESQKFVPAFFVDIVEMGTVFESGEWPHHITMFPPVEEPYRYEYGEQLRHAVNPMTPFDVVVGKSALYGPGREPNVPVMQIEPSLELQKIHTALVAAVSHLLHDPQYRQPYNPHITIYSPHDAVTQGALIHVGGFSIAAKRGHAWEIVDKIGLRGDVTTKA